MTRYQSRRLRAWCLVIVTIGTLVFPPHIVLANPLGGVVVDGSAAIHHAGPVTTINQATNRAVINWQGFSIGRGELTQFNMPSTSSAILNRVTGANPSSILGALQANGQVYLVNPHGIVFGHGAQVHVGGLVASTLDVANGQFMRGGTMHFSGDSDASVVNYGRIRAANGDIYMMGRTVENHGLLEARNGTVGLAAAGSVLLTHGSNEHLVVQVTEKSASVTNTGTIDAVRAALIANGGNVCSLAVNNQAIIRATGAEITPEGRVLLKANGGRIVNNGDLVAKNADGSGGAVTVDSGTGGTTELSGTVDVSGTMGGTAKVLGREVKLSGATIDASGTDGGGQVLVGGDFRGQGDVPTALLTKVDVASAINADATANGDGGRVVVWSDDATSFAGTITARGGSQSGKGGSVEVSGQEMLDFVGQADLRAAAGDAGTLLLDPNDEEINTASTVSGATLLTPATITGQLALGNLVIHTSGTDSEPGDVCINAPVIYESANDFSILAHHDIRANASVQNGAGTAAGEGGDVNMVAGWDGATGFTATPNVQLQPGAVNMSAILASAGSYGNNTGSIFVGNGTQTSGIAVGSRFGATNLAGHALNLTASTATTGAFAHLGFRTDHTQAGFLIDSPITVQLKGNLIATAGVERSYAQIGHGGGFLSNTGTPAGGSYRGDMEITTSGDLTFTGGSADDACAQLGHGDASGLADGKRQGDIDVRLIGEASLVNGTGTDAIWWIGHRTAMAAGISDADVTLTSGTLDYDATNVAAATFFDINSDLAANMAANLGGGNVTLGATNTADGMAIGSGFTSISANHLKFTSAADMDLTAKLDLVGPLTMDATGQLSINAEIDPPSTVTLLGNPVVINSTVDAVDWIDVTAGTSGVQMAAGGLQTTSPTGRVTFNTAGTGVSGTGGTVTTNQLELLGTGAVQLNNAGNAVDIVAADLAGSIWLVNSRALIVRSVGGTDGIATKGNDVCLHMRAGGLDIQQAITATGATVRINSAGGGGVSQSASGTITAGALGIQAGGTVLLDLPGNDVNTLAVRNVGANAGVTYVDANGVSVGTVAKGGCFGSPVVGVLTNRGDVTITSGGTIILSKKIATRLAGTPTKGTVHLTAAGAIVDNNEGLFGPRTDIAAKTIRLQAATGIGRSTFFPKVGKIDVAAPTVNATNNTSGGIHLNSVLGAPVNFNSIQDLTAGDINLLADDRAKLTFVSAANGNVEAISDKAMRAVTVEAQGGGKDIFLRARSGKLTAVDVSSTGGDVRLETDRGAMELQNIIAAATGRVTLDAGDGAQQSGGQITGTELLLLGDGPFKLAQAANAVDTLAADIDGKLCFVNSQAFEVGRIRTGFLSGVNGITTSGNNVCLKTVSAGNTAHLNVHRKIDVGDATIRMNIAGEVSQSTRLLNAARITADRIGIISHGDAILDYGIPLVGNDVNTLAADTNGGSFRFDDSNGYAIGTVPADGCCFTSDLVGLTSADACLRLTAIDAPITSSGTVRIKVPGDLTQTPAGTISAVALGISAWGGDVNLNQDNDVQVFAARNIADGGRIRFNDINDLEIGSVSAGGCFLLGVDGVTTNSGNIAITSRGTMTLTNRIATSLLGPATAGTVTLRTRDAIVDNNDLGLIPITNIRAATVNMEANTGIGERALGGAVDVDANLVNARNHISNGVFITSTRICDPVEFGIVRARGTGNVRLVAFDDATLTDIDTDDGRVVGLSGGSLTAQSVETGNNTTSCWLLWRT